MLESMESASVFQMVGFLPILLHYNWSGLMAIDTGC